MTQDAFETIVLVCGVFIVGAVIGMCMAVVSWLV